MRERSAIEVLLAFLKLGVTSFGGPIAHMGYFHDEFVVRHRWIDDAAYTDLGAALYNPLWTSSVKSSGDFALALVGFVLLTMWRAPPLLVVVIGALGGIALAQATA